MAGSGLIAALGCTGIRRCSPKASDVRRPSQVCAKAGDVWSISQTGRQGAGEDPKSRRWSRGKICLWGSTQPAKVSRKKFEERCRLCIVGINNARNTSLHPVRIIWRHLTYVFCASPVACRITLWSFHKIYIMVAPIPPFSHSIKQSTATLVHLLKLCLIPGRLRDTLIMQLFVLRGNTIPWTRALSLEINQRKRLQFEHNLVNNALCAFTCFVDDSFSPSNLKWRKSLLSAEKDHSLLQFVREGQAKHLKGPYHSVSDLSPLAEIAPIFYKRC